MLTRLSNWLIRVSKGWVALAALALFVLFIAFVLPVQTKQMDADTPDLSLVYAPADLYRMADSYGADGRQEYIRIRFSFDVIWPLVYTFFLLTATGWAFGKAFAPVSRWRLAVLVPLAGIALDFLENLSTSLVMFRYPNHTQVVDALAPVFTFSKWLTLGAGFVLLLVGMIIWVWRRIRHAAGRHA